MIVGCTYLFGELQVQASSHEVRLKKVAVLRVGRCVGRTAP